MSEERDAGASVADLMRRARLVESEGRLSLQDQLDWAEALLHADDVASARMLLQAAAIREGFSRQLAASRASLFDRVGIAAGRQAPAIADDAGTNTVDRAIAELRMLVRTTAPLIAESLDRRPPARRGTPGLHPTAAQRRPAALPSTRSVAALVDDLYDWLNASPHARDDGRGTAAIDALRAAETDASRFNAAALAGAPAPMLAAAIALQELRFFLRDGGDMLLQPLGSPRLFHALALGDSNGLGPWFGNVGRIARRSADIFQLARIAEAEAAAIGIAIDENIWAALLGRALVGGMRQELIDDLGDRDAGFVLRTILDRALSLPVEDIDVPMVMRIRDIGLDNLDYDLAGHAQRAIVRMRPGNMLEVRILAQIDASGGHVLAAQQGFEACLLADPLDPVLPQMIEANRMRRFAPFALDRGFGSPPERQLKRIRLREARAEASAP